MNREELTEAIHDLTDSSHMTTYVLEHAMAMLDLRQLGELFDQVADHHTLTGGAATRPRTRRQPLSDSSAAESFARVIRERWTP
jgi:hypothetical protein